MKYKEVKYRTECFGCLSDGEIINAILVIEDLDGKNALLLHPKVRGECSSIDISVFGEDGIYSSMDKDVYINLDEKTVKKLFGNIKYKRKKFSS